MLKKLDKILITVLVIVLLLVGVKYFEDDIQPRVQGETESVDALKLYYLDIGQGDSTLIRTPNGQDILIDGGPDNTVIKKLGKYLPVNDWDIELMILTHPHADHVTGLVEVLKRYKVDEVWLTGVTHTSGDYLEFLNLIKEKNIKTKFIDHLETVAIEDDLDIEIFYPDKSLFGLKSDNLNNTSIVFKVDYGDNKFLFTGDYENEEELVGKFDLFADIYQVGHHGANNANSLEFLEAVSPKWAIVSVGLNNFYGHPHYRALTYLKRVGAKVFRTDHDGDVLFISNGSDIEEFD